MNSRAATDGYVGRRMAEDDYCKYVDNATSGQVTFIPGQAWCLPRDYNQEKTPFTCNATDEHCF